MRVGFTGTRDGLTFEQLESLREALWALRVTELHHGDCIGADAECDDLARELGIPIVVHPSTITAQRAWRSKTLPCKVLPAQRPLTRNRNIVRAVDFLIAAPATECEVLRSGTWATVRFATKQGVSTFIIFPDGRVEEPASDNCHEQPSNNISASNKEEG